MLFLLTNQTRTDLKPEDYAALGQMMTEFYSNIPPDVKVIAEYSTTQRNKNWSILEMGSREALEALMAPFAPYVDIEVHEVQPTDFLAQQSEK